MKEIKIKKEFFLEDHLPSEQRKWLNFRRGILEDKMKKKEKVKGKKKLMPTASAKVAKKEYNIVIELIKKVIAGEPIEETHHILMEELFEEFSSNIMPGRNIPNNTYTFDTPSEKGKKEEKN